MLPKRARLSRRELAFVMKGTSCRSWAGQVRVRRAETSKGAVTVSKKTAATAVRRNTMRRVAYAALRQSFSQAPTLNVVFFPSEATLERPMADLVHALDDMLAEAWSKEGPRL